jgi:hypothetical protein
VMLKKFKKYLDEELPEGYYYNVSPNGKEITIKNDGQYIYLFYTQELEDDFELCCSLVHTILDLNK